MRESRVKAGAAIRGFSSIAAQYGEAEKTVLFSETATEFTGLSLTAS
jgi:hypothetical protein